MFSVSWLLKISPAAEDTVLHIRTLVIPLATYEKCAIHTSQTNDCAHQDNMRHKTVCGVKKKTADKKSLFFKKASLGLWEFKQLLWPQTVAQACFLVNVDTTCETLNVSRRSSMSQVEALKKIIFSCWQLKLRYSFE